MPINPIITFKAGQCNVIGTTTPLKVKPNPRAGYVYLYSEDDLVHFCWRKRNEPLDAPEIDLVMVPTDGSFISYEPNSSTQRESAKTNGRIFILKFASSSQRHFFWMQSKPQSRDGDASWFSPRDRKIGEIVHRLLQGEEVNVARELAVVHNTDRRDSDNDEAMQDISNNEGPSDHRGSGSGGAGPGATGGDIREEGEESREGGADGARAALSSTPDAAAAVRNLLESLRGQIGFTDDQPQQDIDLDYPLLIHLLPTSVTVPMMDGISPQALDELLKALPPPLILMACGPVDFDEATEPADDVAEAALLQLPSDEKQQLLERVLRSPQFQQALAVLSTALCEGGLPSISDALHIKVENRGYLRDSGIPMGGGHAMKAFVEGVKRTAQEEEASNPPAEDEKDARS